MGNAFFIYRERMMMKQFLRTILLLVVVLLVTSGLLQAQDTPKAFCGDLSQADCALITGSDAVMQALDSHSFKLELTVDATDLPDRTFSNLSFHFTGDGTVSLDRKGLPDVSKLDPSTLSKDPKAIFDLISKSITHLSTDIRLNLELPKQLQPMLGGGNVSKIVKLNMRLVNGDFYVNTAELAPFFPQASQMPAWIGINLPDLITAILKQPSFNASMNSLSSSASTDMSSKYTALFADPKTVAKYLKITRAADSTFESHKVAVFETTVDFVALFTGPEMMQIISDQLPASSANISASDEKILTDGLKQVGNALHFSMTRSIDLEQKYLYQTDANLLLDFSFMKSTFGGPMKFDFKISITQGDFNSVPVITAPKGGVVIPVESIIPSK
jgi:hypothetical protein